MAANNPIERSYRQNINDSFNGMAGVFIRALPCAIMIFHVFIPHHRNPQLKQE